MQVCYLINTETGYSQCRKQAYFIDAAKTNHINDTLTEHAFVDFEKVWLSTKSFCNWWRQILVLFFFNFDFVMYLRIKKKKKKSFVSWVPFPGCQSSSADSFSSKTKQHEEKKKKLLKPKENNLTYSKSLEIALRTQNKWSISLG